MIGDGQLDDNGDGDDEVEPWDDEALDVVGPITIVPFGILFWDPEYVIVVAIVLAIFNSKLCMNS